MAPACCKVAAIWRALCCGWILTMIERCRNGGAADRTRHVSQIKRAVTAAAMIRMRLRTIALVPHSHGNVKAKVGRGDR
jgi:hypothetical protein